MKIQSVWRGHKTRKEVRKQKSKMVEEKFRENQEDGIRQVVSQQSELATKKSKKSMKSYFQDEQADLPRILPFRLLRR